MASDSRQRLLVALGLCSVASMAGAGGLALLGAIAADLAVSVSLAGAVLGLAAGLAVRGRGWTRAFVIPTLTYLAVVLTS